jgi:BirA family transcriptional regulator, biotin operon repressor / biotin---[acetyl-CoA-carboxylase] ligase
MDIRKLKKGLRTVTAIKEVLYFDALCSTQKYAKDGISGNTLKEGSLIIACRQTGGYGRLGRKWDSPDGGLWFSVALKPGIPVRDLGKLIMLVALSMAESLEKESGVKAFIRWPNDILVDDRKIAGCIAETLADAGQKIWLVLGIGINVNNRIPKGLSGGAISMKEASGQEADTAALLCSLVKAIDAKYADFLAGRAGKYVKGYRRRSVFLGRRVRIRSGNREFTGLAEDIDTDGNLALKTGGGDTVKIFSADNIERVLTTE